MAAARSKQSRLIVLTGATRGLGQALARQFGALGHRVLGCGRSVPAGTSPDWPGGPHELLGVDVADDAAVAAWASDLIQRHGPPDLLINNAALMNANAPLWAVPAAEMEDLVRVNILGIANVIRHFAPAMVARQHGVIVNFSSYWGRSVSPEVAPYCATKWAVEGLTRALAQELPKTMAAVPLNPGIIDTDMLRTCFGSQAAGYIEPDAWARVAAPYLLSLGPAQSGKPQTVPGQ